MTDFIEMSYGKHVYSFQTNYSETWGFYLHDKNELVSIQEPLFVIYVIADSQNQNDFKYLTADYLKCPELQLTNENSFFKECTHILRHQKSPFTGDNYKSYLSYFSKGLPVDWKYPIKDPFKN